VRAVRASAVVAALVACVAIIPVWGQWPQGHLRVGGPTGSALCQRDEFCHLTKAEGVGCPGIINVRVFPMPPEMRRINDQEAYSDGVVCINMAEEYFSRLRRAEIGHHHHITGTYLLRYAQEASRREDNRRVTNGEQTQRVAHLAMKRGPSVDFSGYWQRHVKVA